MRAALYAWRARQRAESRSVGRALVQRGYTLHVRRVGSSRVQAKRELLQLLFLVVTATLEFHLACDLTRPMHRAQGIQHVFQVLECVAVRTMRLPEKQSTSVVWEGLQLQAGLP